MNFPLVCEACLNPLSKEDLEYNEHNEIDFWECQFA